MREIRTSGSEGGGAGITGPPYPYYSCGPSGLNTKANLAVLSGAPHRAASRCATCRVFE
jgi:hypothetical protein